MTSSTNHDDDGRRRLLIRIEGDVSMSTLPRLSDSLTRELAGSDAAVVLLDLDGVGTLDDAGLGIILGFAGRVRTSGRAIGIVVSMARVRARLTESRFDRAVDVFSSVLDAGRLSK